MGDSSKKKNLQKPLFKQKPRESLPQQQPKIVGATSEEMERYRKQVEQGRLKAQKLVAAKLHATSSTSTSSKDQKEPGQQQVQESDEKNLPKNERKRVLNEEDEDDGSVGNQEEESKEVKKAKISDAIAALQEDYQDQEEEAEDLAEQKLRESEAKDYDEDVQKEQKKLLEQELALEQQNKEQEEAKASKTSNVSGQAVDNRRSAIEALQIDDQNCSLNLTLVFVEKRTSKQQLDKDGNESNIYTLLCADAKWNYVTVSAWKEQAAILEQRVPMTMEEGAILAFTNLLAKKSDFNMGNKRVALVFKKNSSVREIKKMDKTDKKDGSSLGENSPNATVTTPYDRYYIYQRDVLHKLEDLDSFIPSRIAQVCQGEEFIQLEAIIYEVESLRNISVNGRSTYVKAFLIKNESEQEAAKVTGWGLQAKFLDKYLEGKQGDCVLLDNIELKTAGRQKQFTFNHASRIALKEVEGAEITNSLTELAANLKLGKNNVHLVLRIMHPLKKKAFSTLACTQATDGQHKCQLYIKNTIQLAVGDEVLIKKVVAEKQVNGLFNLTVHMESDMEKQTEKVIPDDMNIKELEYPA